MASRHMDYPSPRGVHVAGTYASDDHDPYRPPHRDRYTRSVHQTPRVRDVTWVSSPEPTPYTPHGPATPWQVPSQVPSSSAYRPQSPIPPSPAPTVGEHMAVDDIIFIPDGIEDPYRPQRPRGGKRLLKSFWNGLKKLSGYQAGPHFPRPGSYGSQMMEVPAPNLSAPSEETQYVDPTPPETDEQQGATPYASPYARPIHPGPGSLRASPVPVPSMEEFPQPVSRRGSPAPVPSVVASPYARLPNLGPASPVIPASLRASPAPVPSVDFAPPITIVSPSIPPSPRPSLRSAHGTFPAVGVPRHPSMGGPGLGVAVAPPVAEEGSQTLHEPAPVLPPLHTQFPTAPTRPANDPKSGTVLDTPVSPDGSLASTVARFRRFVSSLDKLPWVSDAQIADEYVPAENPRSQMRRRVRQGSEPAWYNPRPEKVNRPAYLSEWDMWAMQSSAALQWGGKAPPQATYPHGYVGYMYPPPSRAHTPVVPR